MIKAKTKSARNSDLLDPHLNEQEQLEEALLEKEQRAALLGKQQDTHNRSLIEYCLCCCRKNRKEREYQTIQEEGDYDNVNV
jgi:hypothetical protein